MVGTAKSNPRPVAAPLKHVKQLLARPRHMKSQLTTRATAIGRAIAEANPEPNRTAEFANRDERGVDPVSWIPHHLGEEMPQCQRVARRVPYFWNREFPTDEQGLS